MTLNWRRGLFRLWAVFSILWICGVVLIAATTWRDPNRCDGADPGPWCAYAAVGPAQPSAATQSKPAGLFDDIPKTASPRTKEYSDAEVFGPNGAPGSAHTAGLFDDLFPKHRVRSIVGPAVAWGVGVPAAIYALASVLGWIGAGFKATRSRGETPLG